jgi:hypothetical protein
MDSNNVQLVTVHRGSHENVALTNYGSGSTHAATDSYRDVQGLDKGGSPETRFIKKRTGIMQTLASSWEDTYVSFG